MKSIDWYRSLHRTEKLTVFGSIIIPLFFGIFQLLSSKDGQINNINNGDYVRGDKNTGDTINNYYVTEKIFSDINNRTINNFKEVRVLEDRIIDAQKGYMKIEVSKEYLNSGFDMPVTLSYRSGRYQPVTLTFTNDKQWGAGIIFTSPEKENKSSIYLNQCFRFSGFGKMTYTANLVFELYFNDYCIYLVTNSAECKFEHGLPPIKYGKNLCLGYFNNNDAQNAQASSDFPALEAYFMKYK